MRQTTKRAARQFKIYRPLIFIGAAAAFFIIARIVIAQTVTPTPAAESSYKNFQELLGLIVQSLFLLGLLVGLAHWMWGGHSKKQLEESAKGWKDMAERGQLEISQFETKATKDAAEIKRLKEARVEDRKKINRLQARLSGEKVEDFDEGGDEN